MDKCVGFFSFLIVILLSSCLTLSYDLTFENDESGVIVYKASISTLALDLENTVGGNTIIPVPLSVTSFNQLIDSDEGLSSEGWNQSEDGSRYQVQSEIQFSDFDSLGNFTGAPVSLVQEGANNILAVTVYSPSSEEGKDPSVIQIVNENFPEDYIEIKTEIPGDIIRVQGATFSGSIVTFRASLLELLESGEEIRFTVEYR